MWKTKSTDQYIRRRKQFEKKWPRELKAAETNMHRYMQALDQGSKPAQIQGGCIHREPMGVVAFDERGGGKKEGGKNLGKGLRPTRLYTFPEMQTEVLHTIILGDKSTQSDDISHAKQYVKELEEDRPTQRRDRTEDVQQRIGDGSRSFG